VGCNPSRGEVRPSPERGQKMNINFQNGKQTVIVLNDNELPIARAMVQLVLEAGYVKGEDREKLLRVALTMQGVLLRRILAEKLTQPKTLTSLVIQTMMRRYHKTRYTHPQNGVNPWARVIFLGIVIGFLTLAIATTHALTS